MKGTRHAGAGAAVGVPAGVQPQAPPPYDAKT
jgi:hypothetical protein